MIFAPRPNPLPDPHSDAMRRRHSRWLTAAIADPSHIPRIPVRRVELGGFAPLTATAQGRQWAEQWWSRTFDAVTDS